MNSFYHIVKPSIRAFALKLPWKKREGRLTGIALIFLGIFFWAGLFFLSYWLLKKCLSIEIIGEIFVRKILSISLLTLSGVLLISNIISAFSVFFLSDDLPLLIVSPIRHEVFFSTKFVDSIFQASWMIYVYGLSIFFAAGALFGADLSYYFTLILIFFPLLFIIGAVSNILTHLLALILPAKRTKELTILLAVFLFAVLFVVFRLLEPEKLLDPDNFKSFSLLIVSLNAPEYSLLPHVWLLEILFPLLRGEEGRLLYYGGLLTGATLSTYYLALWLSAVTHHPAWIRANSGAMNRKPDLKSQVLSRSFFRALLTKEVKVFFRDTAQWIQLIILAALVIIYLFNFKSFKLLITIGVMRDTGLLFLNCLIAGLILSAITVRFVFPSISLEGYSFFFIKSAPIQIRDYVLNKFWILTIPLCLFAMIISMTSNLLVQSSLMIYLVSLVIISLQTLYCVGVSLGLGAIIPRFDMGNSGVSKIATSLGAVLCMVISFIGATIIVIFIVAMAALYKINFARYWYGIILLGIGVLAFTFFTVYTFLKNGINRLEKMDL